MMSLTSGLDAAIAGKPFDSITFQLPWTARVFGLMLAASRAGHFSLKTFQAGLINAIDVSESRGLEIRTEEDYYTCWLEALTILLQSKQILTGQQLEIAEDKVRVRLHALEHDHSHSYTQDIPAPIYMEHGKCK
jgi:nitrile hydratase accessory protein